jgi:hypothetical protein
MRSKAVFLILLLPALVLTQIFPETQVQSSTQENSRVFVGVDVAYADIPAIKRLVDEVSSYTNVFGIGCTAITYNTTLLDDVCQYVYDKGLFFMVYREIAPQTAWLESARQRWGNRFLGFYAFDEPGGYQLDLQQYRAVLTAENYSDASNQFVTVVNSALNRFKRFYTDSTTYPLFTSDYALYWFDYKAGYDVVLAQLGWNYSRQLNLAMCRGAATAYGKQWGAIITWTYTEPPYLESGEQLYEDLKLAYANGAKYLLVFDSNKDYTAGTLREEHFEALRRFWQDIQSQPTEPPTTSERVAYVLPQDYAYGFRGPNDKIWGLFQTDNLAEQICIDLNSKLELFQDRLDIIYEDGLLFEPVRAYGTFILWNQTQQSEEPNIPRISPAPSATPTPYTAPQTPEVMPNPPHVPEQTTTPQETPSTPNEPADLTPTAVIGTAATVIAIAATPTISKKLKHPHGKKRRRSQE